MQQARQLALEREAKFKKIIQETEQELEDSDNDEDMIQVLHDQHRRLVERLEVIQSEIEEAEQFAGLMYHIPDPTTYNNRSKGRKV